MGWFGQSNRVVWAVRLVGLGRSIEWFGQFEWINTVVWVLGQVRCGGLGRSMWWFGAHSVSLKTSTKTGKERPMRMATVRHGATLRCSSDPCGHIIAACSPASEGRKGAACRNARLYDRQRGLLERKAVIPLTCGRVLDSTAVHAGQPPMWPVLNPVAFVSTRLLQSRFRQKRVENAPRGQGSPT
eukprot:4522237-Pleurochrysis_carterae.AAC.1